MKTYSIDLRERVIAAYAAGGSTRQQVADRFNVSLGFVKKLLSQRRHTGSIAPRDSNAGRKPIFEGQSLAKLKDLVKEQPDRTLEELRQLTSQNCSIMAVWRALDRLGGRYKKRPSKPASKTAQRSSKSVRHGVKRLRR